MQGCKGNSQNSWKQMKMYCFTTIKKLRNTRNVSEPKLEWNLENHKDILITWTELEKALKLMKNGASPGEDNINSGLYRSVPEEFKLRNCNF